jgi:hypothetical protein
MCVLFYIQVDQERDRVYAASTDGKFCVWDLKLDRCAGAQSTVRLELLYESGVICDARRKVVRPRRVKSVAPCSQVCVGGEENRLLLYVDKGSSLKALDWDRGELRCPLLSSPLFVVFFRAEQCTP